MCFVHFQPSCNPLPAAAPSPSQGNNGSGATLAEKRDLKIDLWRAKIRRVNFLRKFYLICFSNRFISCKIRSHRVCCLGLYEDSWRPPPEANGESPIHSLHLFTVMQRITQVTVHWFAGYLSDDKRCSCIYKASLHSLSLFLQKLIFIGSLNLAVTLQRGSHEHFFLLIHIVSNALNSIQIQLHAQRSQVSPGLWLKSYIPGNITVSTENLKLTPFLSNLARYSLKKFTNSLTNLSKTQSLLLMISTWVVLLTAEAAGFGSQLINLHVLHCVQKTSHTIPLVLTNWLN